MEAVFALYMTVVGFVENEVVVLESGISGYECIDLMYSLADVELRESPYFLSCEFDYAGY